MGKIRYRLRIKETIATIIAESKFIPVAAEEVCYQRIVLEDYISRDPEFFKTLKPYFVPENAPEIVKKMAAASARAGVGPMASVAGAIAYFAVRAMVNKGARYAIFENGGDVAIFTEEPVVIGLYAGEGLKNLGFKIEPRPSIIGLCSSSGKMGHSLSFGQADSVTVVSEDPVLADAVATAAGNWIKNDNPRQMQKTIERFLIPGVEGIMVVMNGQIGLGGKLPEIISVAFSPNLITSAWS